MSAEVQTELPGTLEGAPVEIFSRRLAVDATEHQAADLLEQPRHGGDQGAVRVATIGVGERQCGGGVASRRCRTVDRLQEEVVEHECDVEDRVAVVGHLEVDHPAVARADENVLRREVAVNEAAAASLEPPIAAVDRPGEARDAGQRPCGSKDRSEGSRTPRCERTPPRPHGRRACPSATLRRRSQATLRHPCRRRLRAAPVSNPANLAVRVRSPGRCCPGRCRGRAGRLPASAQRRGGARPPR